MLAWLLAASLCAAAPPAVPGAPTPGDPAHLDPELARALAGYVITLDQAERVARCMDELGSWAQKNAAEVRRINRKVGQGAAFAWTLQVMESEPVLQERIQRHGTTARDLLLLPLALFAAQGGTEGATGGDGVPIAHLANVRFLGEHREAMAHLFERYDENQKALAVR